MIISKTPFRISFFGGGTDFPLWYEEHGGAVLSTTIDKYCYLSCRYLPPFFDNKYRVVYSNIELTQSISEIRHPVVRVCLDTLGFKNRGVEVIHYADLPAKTGIGSSSSFTVGLLNALHALNRSVVSQQKLGEAAIHVEQKLLKESVGSQDQMAAACGGLNEIKFTKNAITVSPIKISKDRLLQLEKSLILIYTGVSRYSSEIAQAHVKNIPNKEAELKIMTQMVDEARNILTSSAPISDFGKLLHESWVIKSKLTQKVSTTLVDDIYQVALGLGADGGKLLGAGGGGFVLLSARPELHSTILSTLGQYLHVPFKFESEGTSLIS
jgi:D-glycero-alpha-D-manno-heptose-7-phosphate kinase